MTPAQCRAARALLEMTQPELANEADLGLSTIVDFEKTRRVGYRAKPLLPFERHVQQRGRVVFIDENGGGPGVRLHKRQRQDTEVHRLGRSVAHPGAASLRAKSFAFASLRLTNSPAFRGSPLRPVSLPAQTGRFEDSRCCANVLCREGGRLPRLCLNQCRIGVPRPWVTKLVASRRCLRGTTWPMYSSGVLPSQRFGIGRFSNRPFGVKRFQTIHHYSVDVAHGLVLLFGIGTKALPSWDSKTRWNNLLGGLAVRRTAGQADMRTHLIHRPARDIIPPLGGVTMLCAASNSTVRIMASPHFGCHPFSRSPD